MNIYSLTVSNIVCLVDHTYLTLLLAGMNQPMGSAPSRGPTSADTGTADNSSTSVEITRKLDNISQQVELAILKDVT